MMACRRLAREATAQLRRGAAPPFAPARDFSSATAAFRAPVASPATQFLARYSSSSLQARASKFGASLAARVALGVRPQLSGLNLIKGFGISTVLAMTLHQGKVNAAKEERPSKDITGPPSGILKNEFTSLWQLVRKLQLPVGLIFLIVSGWQNPLGLVINVLLLIYCSRPNRYSIYLFLQELRHREMHQNHVVLKEEFLHTRKVDTEDYKFFSIGTVELADGKVLHLIGMLGSWWIYRVSYVE
ncbi:uncharacterized protein LOC133914803 [Phragmites australis]|uniref:uncharacterized protein LOC133914803 n=1 Tax=Phragmites australis TaxID=29695 RepID=UPI002D782AA8|nr:uncharacterized protein LOC133914803 [Phragmites australis]